MADSKFKKGDSVRYGPFRDAEVTNAKPNNLGQIEIKTPSGTKLLVDESRVIKN